MQIFPSADGNNCLPVNNTLPWKRNELTKWTWEHHHMVENPERFQVYPEKFGNFTMDIEQLKEINCAVNQTLTRKFAVATDNKQIPRFAYFWPSAKATCKHLIRENLKNQKVLEIGCGLAIPSMMATLLGSQVTAIDNTPFSWPLLQKNMCRNDVKYLDFVELDWNRYNGKPIDSFDLVMGSNIICSANPFENLIGFIKSHLKPSGKFIIADPDHVLIEKFLTFFKRNGFNVKTRKILVSQNNQKILVTLAIGNQKYS